MNGVIRLTIQVTVTALLGVWPVIGGLMAAFVDYDAGMYVLMIWPIVVLMSVLAVALGSILVWVWGVKW